MAELVAIRIDNSEYRDFYPTVDLMISAAERLEAFEAVFNTPTEMHAYLKRVAPERRPGTGLIPRMSSMEP